MKKIEAIIQPHKLDDVKSSDEDRHRWDDRIGGPRPWPSKGHTETYRGQEYKVDLLPKVKVEMVVSDARAEEVGKALAAAARSGKVGDGKIFVTNVLEAIRIRNDDRGDIAL